MNARTRVRFASIVGVLVLAPLVVVAASQDRAGVKTIHENAFKAPFDEAVVKSFLATLPRDGAYFVVEGDILMSEQQVRVYLAAKAVAPRPPGPELTVNVVNGETDFWKDPGQRTLSYAVSRSSFTTEERYQLVVANMRAATQEWEQACGECGVRFVHLDRFDANPTHNDVVFVVRHYNSAGTYIAAAFFPSDAQSRRYVNVDPSYFTTSFDPVGVLRHELGHVLGYRHEHIRGVAGCYQEDTQWRPLTDYDPRSVMHYFCGGAGNLQLTLTDLDRAGHRTLYGR